MAMTHLFAGEGGGSRGEVAPGARERREQAAAGGTPAGSVSDPPLPHVLGRCLGCPRVRLVHGGCFGS